jgi:hypothetical protein
MAGDVPDDSFSVSPYGWNKGYKGGSQTDLPVIMHPRRPNREAEAASDLAKREEEVYIELKQNLFS